MYVFTRIRLHISVIESPHKDVLKWMDAYEICAWFYSNGFKIENDFLNNCQYKEKRYSFNFRLLFLKTNLGEFVSLTLQKGINIFAEAWPVEYLGTKR